MRKLGKKVTLDKRSLQAYNCDYDIVSASGTSTSSLFNGYVFGEAGKCRL